MDVAAAVDTTYSRRMQIRGFVEPSLAPDFLVLKKFDLSKVVIMK